MFPPVPQGKDLADVIKAGIAQRGFHRCDTVDLCALWRDGQKEVLGRVLRMHRFADQHGWQVRIEPNFQCAFFAPKEHSAMPDIDALMAGAPLPKGKKARSAQ